jgi:hypothetical protein
VDERRDDARACTFIHGLDLAASRVDVPDDLTHVVVGGGDLHCHHRLEDHGSALRAAS